MPALTSKNLGRRPARVAGLTLYHDLRRTALTNMIEAEFSENEAITVSGHETRNVFDRYHSFLVSSCRLKELNKKMEDHLNILEASVQAGGASQQKQIN